MQVHWWYSGSTKDSCHEEQNQDLTVSLHGHVTPGAGKRTPADIGCQTGASLASLAASSNLSSTPLSKAADRRYDVGGQQP